MTRSTTYLLAYKLYKPPECIIVDTMHLNYIAIHENSKNKLYKYIYFILKVNIFSKIQCYITNKFTIH